MDQTAVPSGLLACLLLIRFAGRSYARSKRLLVIGDVGQNKMSLSYIQSVLPRLPNSEEKSVAAHMLSIAEMLPRVITEQREETIAQIHNLAGRISFYEDRDLGALALESIGDLITEKEFQKIVYSHAIYRARWCAQSGTSGGESLARANHLKAIEAKLK